MKLPPILLVAYAVSCSCLSAQGVSSPDFRAKESFTELNGADLWNLQNQKLGTIRFLTADLQNARLVEVVVKSGGGFLGAGGRTTAVPPRALIFDNVNHKVLLDISKERFAAAPKFDSSHLNPANQTELVAEVLRYYGLKPWFFVKGQKVSKNAEILQMGYIARADHLLGFPIVNTSGEFIGNVGTLMYDLSNGLIVHVIAVNDNFATPRRVIAPRSLRFNAAKNGLILDQSLDAVEGKPRFQWLNGERTAFKQETYVNREVEADRGAQLAQGENFRDTQKTNRIKQAIQADPSLSASAKAVDVATLHARTTLRGTVTTAQEKQRIGQIAAKVGRGENISNLIEVR